MNNLQNHERRTLIKGRYILFSAVLFMELERAKLKVSANSEIAIAIKKVFAC